jgi:hypothetical protein
VAADAQGDGRDAERGGRLGRPLAQGVAHGDLALAGREGPQGPGHRVSELPAAGLLVRVVREGRGELLQGLRRPRSASAREPAGLVAGDDGQPGRDVARRDPADRGEDAQPHLLDGVVRVVAVAQDAGAEVPQAGVVARHEGRQRGMVAVAGGEGQPHVDVGREERG